MRLVILLTLLFNFSFLSHTFAEEDEQPINKFAVKNIAVDEVDASSELAKKNAIKKAQKQAFETMLGRFFENIQGEEFNYDEIAKLVQAVEFHDELVTDRRYKANLDIYFRPEQTEFFINSNLLNKESKKVKILLIPVLVENGMVKLWQRGNIWYDNWLKNTYDNAISIRVPSGNIEDIMNFKIGNLEHLTEERIAELNKIYGSNKILIAELDYQYQTIAPEVNFRAYLRELGENQNATLVATSDGVKSDPFDRHLAYLSERIVKNLEAGWISYSSKLEDANRQTVIMKTKNIQDWLESKKRLSELKYLKSFKVNSFSGRYAQIILEFSENPLEVFENIRQLGFKVSRENNNVILQTE